MDARADLSSHPIEGFTRPDLGGQHFSMSLQSEIEPGLWQGGTPGTLGPYGIFPKDVTAVLNLYGDTYLTPRERAIEVRTEPLYDSRDQELDRDRLEELAAWVNAKRDAGGTVLVHCQAGLNRSGLITALSLMRRHGMSAEDAIALQRERRSPAVLCNAHFERWLLEEA